MLNPSQSWVDRRLAFEDSTSNVSTLALSISMLKKIWKPDTFIFNGKQVDPTFNPTSKNPSIFLIFSHIFIPSQHPTNLFAFTTMDVSFTLAGD